MADRHDTSTPARPAVSPPTPSRQTGSRNVRVVLLAALERLLQERRINELTVGDICQEAGVSRPTFYVHFDSKLAAVSALAEKTLEQIYEDLWHPFAASAHRSESFMTKQWLRTLKRWREHRAVLEAAGQAWRYEPDGRRGWNATWDRYVSVMRNYIERVRADGDAPREFDANTLATLLVCMIENAFFLRFSGAEDELPDDERFAQTLSRVWLRSIFGSEQAANNQPSEA
jgi:AcrR family transcriptional regulator